MQCAGGRVGWMIDSSFPSNKAIEEFNVCAPVWRFRTLFSGFLRNLGWSGMLWCVFVAIGWWMQ